MIKGFFIFTFFHKQFIYIQYFLYPIYTVQQKCDFIFQIYWGFFAGLNAFNKHLLFIIIPFITHRV